MYSTSVTNTSKINQSLTESRKQTRVITRFAFNKVHMALVNGTLGECNVKKKSSVSLIIRYDRKGAVKVKSNME